MIATAFLAAACGTTTTYESTDSPTAARPQAPDDRDYSVSTLFHERHAETLQRARGYRPDVRIAYLNDSDVALKGEPGSFDIHQISLDAVYETPVDPDSWLRLGTHVRVRDFEVSPALLGADDDEQLNEVGLVLGGGRFLDSNTFVEGQFEPGVYTDFDSGLHSEDWQFYGHVRATLRHDENLFWKVGLRHDDLFEDLDLYPELGLGWQFLENWRLEVFLPHHITVTWNPQTALLLEAGLELEGNEYHVSGPPTLGKARSKWQTQTMRVYGGGTWRFTDQLGAFGRLGTTIGGDYEFNGVNGQSNGTPEASFFFEAGMTFHW